MKKNALMIVLLWMASKGVGQPLVSTPSFPPSVNLFDLFEVSFTLGNSYANPYDPETIEIRAVFVSPDGTQYPVDAFYFEDYAFQKAFYGNDYYEKVSDSLSDVAWRIRFTPNCVGRWKFNIYAKDATGTTQLPNNNLLRSYSFFCNSVSEARGFITNANARYLKRDVVKNGQRRHESFFPVGPNVAWYDCIDYCVFSKPRGIYYYEERIDSLHNNANYMRVWINRYQYLSLYGLEYTQKENGVPRLYFDSSINQKDSAELDYIVSYARQSGIAVMLNIFNHNDFTAGTNPCSPSVWAANPYHTVLNLENPCEFFTDARAIKITKNLIRYIVSRWGYATNVMCWELWNEVNFVKDMCQSNGSFVEEVRLWHETMVEYINNIDPYHHCVSTSSTLRNSNDLLYANLFHAMDINQQHVYQDIQKAKTRHQPSYAVFFYTEHGHEKYPSTPFFMGESGYSHKRQPYSDEKDPHGIELHNTLWSSLFSAAIGPASIWWWDYINSCGLHKRFAPVLKFCTNLPLLSETFTENYTAEPERGSDWISFPNGLRTHYMINATEDTIMGWSQDTAFAYQSLRWLTDSVRLVADTIDGTIFEPYSFVNGAVLDPGGYVYTLDPTKKPRPCSNSNIITIPISNQPIGTQYRIRWYNSETGLPYSSINPTTKYIFVNQDASGDKVLSFPFPNFIRDLQKNTVNNTFGDAVFVIYKYETQKPEKTE